MPRSILLTSVYLLLSSLHDSSFQVYAAYVPTLQRIAARAAEDTLLSGIPRPPQPPPIYNHTAEDFRKVADEVSGKEKAVVDEIVASVDESNATFDNVLLPYLQWENELTREQSAMDTYTVLGIDSDLQSVAENASLKISSAQRATYSRQDYFKLVDVVYKKFGNDSSLTSEDQRVLSGPDYGPLHTGMWAHFKNSGQDVKDDSERARVAEIFDRLDKLFLEFDNASNDDNSTILFTAAELEGVTSDFLAGLEKGDGDKLIVPLTESSYESIIGKAKNETTRQETYIAYGNKAPSNIDRLHEIVTLRDEAARLLGFPNYATFKVKDHMAKTPKAIDDFLVQLFQRLSPGAQKVLDHQRELKKAETGNADHLYLWDLYYYETKMDEERSVNNTLISEWFETNATLKRVLDIYSMVYGLRFDRIEGSDADQLSPTGNGSDILLHPDQHLYAVWDAVSSPHHDDSRMGSTFQGYLYVDLFERDNKDGGGYETPVNTGYNNPDGSRFHAAACATLNLVKSTTEKPSFFTRDDLGDLFHELGHSMHQILSAAKYCRLNGPGGTPVDFIETPSQLMEQYPYIPEVLKRLSQHYSYISPKYAEVWKKSQGDATNITQPEETLPAAQIDSIIESKNIYSAWEAINQVFLGTYDMRIHEPTSQQAIKDLDMTVLFNQLRHNLTFLDGPETLGKGWSAIHRQSIFYHFSTSTYGSGYYSYQYSLVNSLDALYAVFLQDPFSSETGARWRKVLEAGGTKDPEVLLEEFLGRKPSDEAYYKDLNITNT